MRKTILFLIALLTGQAALAEIRGHEVSYEDNGITFKAYIAYDDSLKGRRPGVLVVHEWWGHNEYARKRARMLAGMGYLALAVDMYGDGKTAAHPKEAGAFASAVSKDMATARSRFEAALKYLRERRIVEPDNIAAIGYCFGGGIVLNMARQGVDLKGVASFHGTLSSPFPAEAGRVKARIAVYTGADDPMVPPAQVDAFKAEMAKADVKYSLVSYPGVKHSFTNPDADEYAVKFGLPVAYDALADRDSWAQVSIFLANLFAQP